MKHPDPQIAAPVAPSLTPLALPDEPDRPFLACNPNEWPYDLEARHGTPDFEHLVRWFADRHPALNLDALDELIAFVRTQAGARPMTAEVVVDPELGDMTLWLRVYGFKLKHWPNTELDRALDALLDERPDLAELFAHVMVEAAPQSHRAQR